MKLTPAVGFKDWFNATYGRDAYSRFIELLKQPDVYLTTIAAEFNITRAAVSALFRKAFGLSYSEVLGKRKSKHRKLERIKRKVSRHRMTGRTLLRNSVAKAAQKRGLDVSVITSNNTFRPPSLLINNKRCWLAEGRPHRTSDSQKQYVSAGVPSGLKRPHYVIIVGHLPNDKRRVWIIPGRELVGLKGLTLPSRKTPQSKYEEYVGAWNLLR